MNEDRFPVGSHGDAPAELLEVPDLLRHAFQDGMSVGDHVRRLRSILSRRVTDSVC